MLQLLQEAGLFSSSFRKQPPQGFFSLKCPMQRLQFMPHGAIM
jgi:hypothetical protein